MTLWLLVGVFLTSSLFVLGQVVLGWIEAVNTQWHYGDSRIAQLDADVGHGGMSHFVCQYYHGTLIVIEFAHNSDPGHEQTYSLHVSSAQDTTVRTVSLEVVPMGGHRNLVVHLQGQTIGFVLYNTGSAFAASPQS